MGPFFFSPKGIILTNLVGDHKVMLHSKHQGSRPYGFHIQAYVKRDARMGPFFWSQGHNLNNFDKSSTILLPRPLRHDPRFIQCIYRYSHASKRLVEV